MAITDKYTLEEICLIKICNTHDKDMAVQLLQTYLDNVPSKVVEIINQLVNKLQRLSDEEFVEIVTYPLKES